MSTSRNPKEMPAWVLPLVAVAGVLLIVFIAWRALAGGGGVATEPDRPVHPGMYDFRKEAQNGTLGRRQTPDGGPPR